MPWLVAIYVFLMGALHLFVGSVAIILFNAGINDPNMRMHRGHVQNVRIRFWPRGVHLPNFGGNVNFVKADVNRISDYDRMESGCSHKYGTIMHHGQR